MSSFESEQVSSLHLGHLGLVADKIESLGLIELIDRRLPVSEEHGSKVTHGERVAAMIFNGLGFIDSRLYLFPEFLSDKPLDRLFNRSVKPEWFNDDVLGRCLDTISDYGSNKLFTELSLHIGQTRGLLGKSIHVDTTTLSLYGDYEQAGRVDEAELYQAERVPEYGYAKSGRHDLKQMILLLATTGAAHFPLWMEAHSGNASDQVTLPEAAVRMRQFCKGLSTLQGDFIYVGDSAIYANILEHSDVLSWITRVPERVLQARDLVSSSREDLVWTQLNDGYSCSARECTYKGVKQRWVLFYSEAAYQRETKTLDKKIVEEYEEQKKAWWHLSNRVFTCRNDALYEIEVKKKETVKILSGQCHSFRSEEAYWSWASQSRVTPGSGWLSG